MPESDQTESRRQALNAFARRGLLREIHRRGGISEGQLARLLEERRG